MEKSGNREQFNVIDFNSSHRFGNDTHELAKQQQQKRLDSPISVQGNITCYSGSDVRLRLLKSVWVVFMDDIGASIRRARLRKDGFVVKADSDNEGV